MDEEDIREADESRIVNTSSEFAGFGTEHDPNRQAGLSDLFRPLGDTMGVKLLKRMGWKEGQGIGPKVRRQANIDDEGGTSEETHFFAPDDPPMILFSTKSDHKGLGYDGEIGLPQSKPKDHAGDGDNASSKSYLKTAAAPRKGGFGVGILNDTGSDEEDSYEMGPKISYDRTMGGDKKSKKQKATRTATNPLLTKAPVFILKKTTVGKSLAGFRKCHDGRLPLAGFVLSTELDAFSTLSLEADKYKPLEVPADWKPSRQIKTSDHEAAFVSTRDAAKSSSHDAKSRADLLGEGQLPGQSIFDFISPTSRNRLADVSGRPDLPSGNAQPTSSLPQNDVKELDSQLPTIDPSTAAQALTRTETGWTPYPDNPAKSSRYTTFLTHFSHSDHQPASNLLSTRPSHIIASAFLQELHEFARVTQVFRPVSGLMATRFTASTTSTLDPNNNSTSSSSLLTHPSTKLPSDPATEAAKLGMFGPGLTRTVAPWTPTRLLCKRFGVPMPETGYGEAMATSTDHGALRAATAKGSDKGRSVGKSELTTTQSSTAGTTTSSQPGLRSGEMSAAIDPTHNAALEGERPGKAVFRAIFGDDDDEEDEDND